MHSRRLQASLAGLLAATSAVRAEVIVSPEVPIAERMLCPAEAADASLALGPGGGGLVVWLDWRYDTTETSVMAARIDASGALLDAEGTFVGAAKVSGHPRVAFDGSRYLLAWSTNTGVNAARIAMNGTLVDTTAIPIATHGDTAAVAGGSGQFLVTWQGPNNQVLATRVGDDAAVLDATPLVLGSGSFVRGGPSAIFDGTNYVVVWSGAGIQAARVSPTGAVIAPGQVDLIAQIIGNTPTPSLVFDGSQYLVAWDDGGLKQMRVSTSMVPLDAPMSFYGAGDPPSLAFDGTRYTMALEQDIPHSAGKVQLVNVSTTNTSLGSKPYALPGPAGFGQARLVYNGSHFLLGFISDTVFGGARVATDGTILDTTPLTWSQTKNDQSNPAVAFDGASQYLVAWKDSRDINLRTSVVIARLDASGGRDGTGIVVSANIDQGGGKGHVALERPRTPGSTALVVWDEDFPPALRGARVNGSGEVIDPDGFVVVDGATLDAASSLAVACMDTTCLVVWEDESFNIRGVRVGLDGRVVDSTPLNLGLGISPRVTASNGLFLVTGGAPTAVAATGSPQPIGLPASAGYRSWDLDWDGSSFLMVWSERIGQQFRLQAIRLDSSGAQVGQPTQLATLDQSVIVTVVHDGSEWIVTWYPYFLVNPYPISAARIAPDGTIHDPGGVAMSTATGAAAFASGSGGSFMMLREVTTDITPDRGTRITASQITIAGSSDSGPGSSGGGCCRSDGGGSGPAVLGLLLTLTVRRSRQRKPKRL